jgi:chromosome partitioning protein
MVDAFCVSTAAYALAAAYGLSVVNRQRPLYLLQGDAQEDGVPIISVFNPKGGSGKSTTSLILASELAAIGAPVAMIDGDPNTNLYRWAEKRSMPVIDTRMHTTEGVREASVLLNKSFGDAKFVALKNSDVSELPNWIDACDSRYSFTILDPEGTANDWASLAVTMSDLVIVPLRPAPMDADQMLRAVKLIEAQGRALRRPIPFRLLFTCNGAIVTRDERQIREFVDSKGHPVFNTSLYERAAYRAMFSRRETLQELPATEVSNIAAARRNAAELVAELVETLNAIQQVAA